MGVLFKAHACGMCRHRLHGAAASDRRSYLQRCTSHNVCTTTGNPNGQMMRTCGVHLLDAPEVISPTREFVQPTVSSCPDDAHVTNLQSP